MDRDVEENPIIRNYLGLSSRSVENTTGWNGIYHNCVEWDWDGSETTHAAELLFYYYYSELELERKRKQKCCEMERFSLLL